MESPENLLATVFLLLDILHGCPLLHGSAVKAALLVRKQELFFLLVG